MTAELKVKIVHGWCYSYVFVDGEKVTSYGKWESTWLVVKHCAYYIGHWLDLRDMSGLERDRRLCDIMDQLLKLELLDQRYPLTP